MGINTIGKKKFVEVNGNYFPPVPLHLKGTKYLSFVFGSNRDKLQQVFDEWFNKPLGVEGFVRPLWSDVIITFADYKDVVPESAPYCNNGYCSHQEVFIMMFGYYRQKKWFWHVKKKVAFIPYIFVDQPQAMSCGREIYGLPKVWGSFSIPEKAEKDPSCFSLYAPLVLRSGPVKEEDGKVLEVKRTSAPSGKIEKAVQLVISMLKDVARAVEGKGLILLGLKMRSVLSTKKIPFIALRQYYDTEGKRTCYRSAVTYSSSILKLRKIGVIPGKFTLNVSPHPLFPLANDLGLKEKDNPCKATFYMDLDFRLNGGEELKV